MFSHVCFAMSQWIFDCAHCSPWMAVVTTVPTNYFYLRTSSSKNTSVHLSHLLIPQPCPSGLEGYCCHGPGGWVGGCQTCRIHISVTAWWVFSFRSSVELSRPVVVHCHGHLPHMGLPMHIPKSCQIWHKLGPDFVERRFLKPLYGFSPFKALWTCLDLSVCTVIIIKPFAPHGLAHGPKFVKGGSTWTRLCGSHFSETAGWIYTIQSYMELSKPVVV